MASKDTSDQEWLFWSAHLDTSMVDSTTFQVDPIYDEDEYLLYTQFPTKNSYLFNKLRWSFLWSILLVIGVFGSFWYALSIIQKQKQLSELKNDFINNMTHEFKTPIATISFAIANIENPQIIQNPDRIKEITKIIKEENIRMNGQVEKVLFAARATRKELEFKYESVNLHEIINQLADATEMKVQQLGGQFVRRLNAAKALVIGDGFHLSNAIANLLDNHPTNRKSGGWDMGTYSGCRDWDCERCSKQDFRPILSCPNREST